MNILAVAPNFGFGPVSKLVAIVNALIERTEDTITVVLSGNALQFAKINIKNERVTFVNINLETVTPEWMLEMSRDFDVLLNVMHFEVQDSIASLEKDYFGTKIFVDSLNWLWNEKIVGIEKNDVYFAQKYEARKGVLPKNAIQVDDIVSIPYVNQGKVDVDQILVNVAGIILPGNGNSKDTQFMKTYIQFWIDCLSEIALQNNKSMKVILAVNEAQKRLNFKISDGVNLSLQCFSHQDFIETALSSGVIFSTPGLTFRNESNMLNLPVHYLLPSNYSQALLLEDYVNNGSLGLNFKRFGNQYEIKFGLEEMEGVRQVRQNVTRLMDQKETIINQMIDWMKVPATNKQREIKSVVSTGAYEIVDYITTRY